MRESTSKGPVRSIWSMPSKSSEPMVRWVSCGTMTASSVSTGRGQATAASFGVTCQRPLGPSPTVPRTIEILAFPGVQLLDVAGPLQVFATCNDRRTAAGSAPPYAPRVIACGATSIVTSSGLALSAEPLPKPDTDVDTLIVAGGNGVTAASRDR